jgi:hypothetical protein
MAMSVSGMAEYRLLLFLLLFWTKHLGAAAGLCYWKVLAPFWRRQSLQKNQRRCSLVRRGRSAAQGRTVRDLA